MNSPLVTTDWLAAALGAPDLVVFDCTKYLPNENRDGAAEFLDAHIPGALFFDIDKIADQDTDLPHMIPTAGQFAKMLGALGVSNTSRVVFYDQKGLASAARGWWMMELFGHSNAAVLDGGLPKWRKENRALESGAARTVNPATFRPDFRASRVAGIGDMLHHTLVRDATILDARAAARFAGTAPEPRAGMRGGHMPGSTNLPYTDLLNDDQTFHDPAILRGRFHAAGVRADRPVITSCGTGVTACILTLGLALAGLPQGRVYDGSWTEWGGRPDTPVESN